MVAGLAKDADAVYPSLVVVAEVDPRDDLPRPASPKIIRCQPLRPGVSDEGVAPNCMKLPEGNCSKFALIKECATISPDAVCDIGYVECGRATPAVVAAVPATKRRLEDNFSEPVALQYTSSTVKRAK